MGALQAFNLYEPEYVAVRSDNEGIVMDELEVALQRKPRGMYVLPSFQNPSGVTFTLERRQQLIELAGRYNVPIIEDDPAIQVTQVIEAETLTLGTHLLALGCCSPLVDLHHQPSNRRRELHVQPGPVTGDTYSTSVGSQVWLVFWTA